MTNFNDTEALGARVFACSEPFAQRFVQPGDQRVGAKVLLHHQISRSSHLEFGQPGHEQRMQGLLADANRGVRPYRIECEVAGNRLAMCALAVGWQWGAGFIHLCGVNIAAAIGLGVDMGEFQGAFVDVHGPYVRFGRCERQSEGDWPPAATQIQHIAGYRRFRSVLEQHGSAQVDAGAGKHSVRYLYLGIMTLQRHIERAAHVL